jgi:hypothetical protein
MGTFLLVLDERTIYTYQRLEQTAETAREAMARYSGEGLDVINRKIDVLLDIATVTRFPGDPSFLKSMINWRTSAGLIAIGCLWLAIQMIRKFSAEFVVSANPFTEMRLNKAAKNREYMKWAVGVSLIVGIVADLIAARIDRLF